MLACLLAWVLGVGSPGVAGGAPAGTVVTVTVGSSSWIDGAGCTTGTASVTDFGTVMPGSSSVTGSDCAVKFGSSNDTAMLRSYQQDGTGTALRWLDDDVLDTTFSGDGMQSTNFAASQDYAYSVAVDANGKVVLAGYSLIGAGRDFALARFNDDGTLDGTFDTDGKVTTSITAGDDYCYGMAIDSTGRIVCAGMSSLSTTVTRYNANGSLDTTFDTDGIATTSIGSAMDLIRDVAIDSSNRIVVAGQAWNGGAYDVGLARFNTDGSLDTTFDGDGKRMFNWAAGNNTVEDMDIDPNGKIVVIGGTPSYDFGVARLNADGSLDASFDGDGRVITSLDTDYDTPGGVAIDGSGRLVVAGQSSDPLDGTGRFAVVRYSSNGSLDPTFSGDGVTIAFGNVGTSDGANDVGIDGSGRIVAVGQLRAANYDYAVARFNDDGSVDTTFDTDGVITVSWAALADNAVSMAFDASGKIVAGGFSYLGGAMDFSVMRFGVVTPISDYANGTTDWDTAATSLFGACLRSVANGGISGGTAWTEGPANACPTTDGAYWNAIPTTAPGAKIASTAAPDAQGGSDPVANLRFGFRARSNEKAATYRAPIVFETIAPNT